MHSLRIEARGVSVAFRASTPVLDDVHLHLTAGWYGLVGANGAGKTSLLRLFAGDLAPSAGAVRVLPADASVVLVAQSVEELTPDVRAFVEASSGRAASLRGRLRLDAELGERALDHWHTLSPGERKRWQLGAALAADPDILLLDEPTNHLDRGGRALLVNALATFGGIGVVVSHDRELLDELPSAILRVHSARVTLHKGGYGTARAEWEIARRAEEAAHASAKREVRALEARLVTARDEHASVERMRNAKHRMKNIHDHDANDGLSTFRVDSAAARAGKTVGVVRASLRRAERAVPTILRDRTLGGHVFATYERAPRSRLLHFEAQSLEVGTTTLLRDVRVDVERTDRLRITGPNGAGKTTLSRALFAAAPESVRARTLYLPQEIEPAAVQASLDDLWSSPAEERGRVLTVFAALGSDPERLLGRRDASLSPGEARKLALARGLGSHAWALVLDEPTNHLDLPSIERLEAALVAFPGAIVLVTHDDALARATTTRELAIEGGLLRSA